jgi:hypothetical protein
MSHFTVAVFLDPTIQESDILSALEKALAPFDENLETDRYVSKTKEAIIADGKERIATSKERYEQYRANPEKYTAECSNKQYVAWLRDEFPVMLEWTDEQIYQDRIKSYGSDDISPDGGIYSTRNPQSKWDWWDVGGRFGGMLLVKGEEEDFTPVNQARLKDIEWGKMQESDRIARKNGAKKLFREDDEGMRHLCFGIEPGTTIEQYIETDTPFATFAVITPDGEWHESATMGFWAVTYNEKESEEEWGKKFHERFLKDANPETILVVVDCHI